MELQLIVIALLSISCSKAQEDVPDLNGQDCFAPGECLISPLVADYRDVSPEVRT